MSGQRRIEQRLVALRAELVEGERAVRELDLRRERLVSSMLRIGGAIQVLEELVAETPDVPDAQDSSNATDVADAPAEALPTVG